MKINFQNKIIRIIFAVIVALESASLVFDLSFAQVASTVSVPRKLDVSALILNNENKVIANGEYDVRFSIYQADRTDNTQIEETPLWTETQKVTIYNGILHALPGIVTPLPANINFSGGEYYVGIKMGTDSEMVPRKRIGAVPLALDSFSVGGATIGTNEGNILKLGAGGKVDIASLPTGTSGKKLVLASDSRLSGGKITVSGQKYITASGMKLTLKQIDLTSNVTGILPITNGGMGLSSYTAGDMLYASATTTLSKLAIGVDGKVLTVSGGLPSWQDAASGGNSFGTLSVAGQSDVVADAANDTLTFVAGTNMSIATNAAGDSITLNATDTNTTYTAAALNLLQLSGTEFSVKQGLMTDTRICTYDATDGLICNTLAGGLGTNYWQRNGTAVSPATIGDYVGIGTTAPGSKLTVSGGLSVGTTSATSVYLTTLAPDGGAIFEGNIGIGTTDPGAYKLNINGSLNVGTTAVAASYCIGASCISSWGGAGTNYWQRNGTAVSPATIGDYVGIGTTAPSAALEVIGAILGSEYFAGTSSGTTTLQATGTTSGGNALIAFDNSSGTQMASLDTNYSASSISVNSSGDLSVGAGTTTINQTETTGLTTGASSGQKSVYVNSSTGFSIGDLVLIVQMKGGMGTGTYEQRIVTSVISSTRIVVDANLTSSYTQTTNGRCIAADTNCYQVVKVPRYGTVSVATGGTLTAPAWNSTTGVGGVLWFDATGAVTVNSGGSINMDGKGWAGGTGGAGGIGGATYHTPGNIGNSGNVGEGPNAGNGGLIGGSFGTVTGANSGGGAGGTGGGGGGAGYDMAGSNGTNGVSGAGGDGDAAPGTGGSGGVGVGGTGGSSLSVNFNSAIPIGSGGGGGAGGHGGAAGWVVGVHGGDGGTGGAGGTGGGILIVHSAASISNSGTISANGTIGNNGASGQTAPGGCSGGGSGAAGGGGGAGGSVWLNSSSITSGTTTVTGGGAATGGNGGNGTLFGLGCNGGGGAGVVGGSAGGGDAEPGANASPGPGGNGSAGKLDTSTSSSLYNGSSTSNIARFNTGGLNLLSGLGQYTQIYEGENANAFSITADSLAAGKGINLTSASTLLTGALGEFTLSGDDAGNTGSILSLINSGTANTGTTLYIKNYSAGPSFRIDDVASDTTPFIIDANGSVGIGFTSPGSKLTISGGLSVGTTSATSVYLTKLAPDGGAIFEGNVGIGTTDPTDKLHVGNGATNYANMTAQTYVDATDAYSNLHLLSKIGANNSGLTIISHSGSRTVSRYGITLGGWNEISSGIGASENSNGLVIGTQDAAPLAFGTNNAEIIRISSTGFVGIGTTDPGTYKLNINGSLNVGTTAVAASYCIGASCISSWGGAGTNYWQRNGTAVSPATIGDYVGIGTTAPGSKLTVSGGLSIGTTSATSVYLTTAAPDGGAIFEGNVGIGTTAPGSFMLAVAGDIGPTADNVYSLGSATNRFKDLYLGPSSFHLYNTYTDASNYEQGFFGYEGAATTNSSLDFDAGDESTFSQEDFVYDTTATPSATTGNITITLGSGNWNTNSKIVRGTRIAGNGGVAIITSDPAAQTTIYAKVITDFANTNAIASGSWHVYATQFSSGSISLSANSSTGYTSDICTTPANYIQSSQIDANWSGDKAYDNDISALGHHWGANTWSGYIGYNFGTSDQKIIREYTIQFRADGSYNDQTPKNWTFEGWNGSSWEVIQTVTNNSTMANSELRTFYPISNKYYSQYRLNISTNQGSAGNVVISEIQMMEEYPYPANNVYTVATTDSNQMNTSDWSAITSISTTETLNSQEIHYSVSMDDRTTWKIYDTTGGDVGWRPIARNNGGTWQYNSNVTAGATDITWTNSTTNNQDSAISQATAITANQMSSTILADINTSEWSSVFSAGTFDLAMSMESSSITQAPSLNQITVNYQGGPSTGIMTLGTRALGSGTVRDFQLKTGDNIALYASSNGNLGIGMTNPTYNLQVAGTLGVGGTAYFASYVGIGTTSPNIRLHVVGGNNAGYVAGFQKDLSSGSVDLGSAGTTGGAIQALDANAAVGILALNPLGGYVGIGTTAPGQLLEISNTAGAAAMKLTGSGANVVHTITNEYDINYTRTTGNAIMDLGAFAANGTGDSYYRFGLSSGSSGAQYIQLFQPNGSVVQTQLATSATNSYINAGGGNLGIGFTAPGSRLTLSGGLAVGTTSASSSYLTKLAPDGGAIFEGNVGIGTTNPLAKLQITGTSNATQFIIRANATQSNSNPLINILDSSGSQLFSIHSDSVWNVFMGSSAGGNNTINGGINGLYNTFVGSRAGRTNTTGGLNSAFGDESLDLNSTGNYNTAIGTGSLAKTSSGSNNTALGAYAAISNQTGSNNTVIGSNAGSGVTSNSFSNNSILGYSSGLALSTGSNNILLGYQAANALVTGANNIVIGYDIDLPGTSSSNMLDIGNLIYATNINSTGTTLSSGNVGIGFTSPGSKLTISGGLAVGTTSATSAYLTTLAPSGGAIFEGNVGIGTTNPGYKLDVIGNIRAKKTTPGGEVNFRAEENAGYSINMGISNSTSSFLNTDSSRLNIIAGTAGVGVLSILDGGNFGIGTADPGTAGLAIMSGNVGIGYTAPGSKLTISGGLSVGTTSATSTYLATLAPDGGALFEGFVGIGTTAPTSPLEIAINQGSIYASALKLTNLNDGNYGTAIEIGSGTKSFGVVGATADDTGGKLEFKTYGATFATTWLVIRADGDIGMGYADPGAAKLAINGDVGIGTTAPRAKLEVNGYTALGIGVTYSGSSGANGAWNTGLTSSPINTSIYASSAIISGAAFYNVSDRRLKDNINTLETNVVDEFLSSVNPVHFNWRSDGTTDSGFIAQELISSGFGYLVSAIPDSSMSADNTDGFNSPAGSRFVVRYDSVIPLLTAAAKEQRSQIIELSDLQATQAEDVTSIESSLQNSNSQIGLLKTQLADNNVTTTEKINLVGTSLSQISTKQTTSETKLTTLETKVTSLESQMAMLEEKYKAVIDFAAVLEADRLVYKDEFGNVNILRGQLEAEGVVAGAFTIKTADKENKTIGQNYIASVKKDDDMDGFDDNDPTSDGKNYFVKTKAVTATSKIFITPQGDAGGTVWVEKKMDNEGNYMGFIIKCSIPVKQDTKIDWFIVEEK